MFESPPGYQNNPNEKIFQDVTTIVAKEESILKT